jgi:hypothetical protein
MKYALKVQNISNYLSCSLLYFLMETKYLLNNSRSAFKNLKKLKQITFHIKIQLFYFPPFCITLKNTVIFNLW